MPTPLHFRLFITASEKGGVGKTLIAQALYDRLGLEDHPPAVIQIDRQHRLVDVLGTEVLTIASDPKAARGDPELEHRRFSPLLERIEAAAGVKPVIIDIGAGEVGRFANWAALVELQEDLDEWGLPCTVLLPYLAESESIRQAAWSAARLHAVLPQANIVLIENRRDGQIDQLHPSSDAAAAFAKHVKPWLRRSLSITVPRIPGGSWRRFEAANCKFTDVVVMTPETVMKITGLPRAEAKIIRGDVSLWLIQVFDEFDRIFSLQK